MARTKDDDNLNFRNNSSQLIVNCTNNHPITSLYRGQLYIYIYTIDLFLQTWFGIVSRQNCWSLYAMKKAIEQFYGIAPNSSTKKPDDYWHRYCLYINVIQIVELF